MEGHVLAVEPSAGMGFGFELMPESFQFEATRETMPAVRDMPVAAAKSQVQARESGAEGEDSGTKCVDGMWRRSCGQRIRG